MNTRKANPYLKTGIFLLLSAIGGAILGAGTFYIINRLDGGIDTAISIVMTRLQTMILPLLLCITLISILTGELTLKKLKHICEQILQTEDEDCDIWEYKEEKTSAFGMNMNILSQVLCVIILSLGYSMKYIETTNSSHFLFACLVFILCYAYDGFWQIRYIRLIQNTYPEKKGDPSSMKFQQQWLESCDEAEKEVIFQSAYKAYLTLNKGIPLFLLVTMLSHLFLDTGLLAIVVVAVIWLLISFSYTHSCVALKKKRMSG